MTGFVKPKPEKYLPGILLGMLVVVLLVVSTGVGST